MRLFDAAARLARPRRVGLALLLVLPGAAAAQSPADRAALERFRDSLTAISDSMALLARERRMIADAKADRSNPILHLRLGFVALRLGDLGGKGHYDDAASEFEWATELQPEWPYGWYGLGLAEYGVGDSQISIVAGLKTMLGKDALTRSAMAFARSARVDPAFVHGLVELGATALRQRVNIKLDVALEALRRAAETSAGQHPEVLLTRGRVEREVGDLDSARVALAAYLASGVNPALGRLELARTLFLLGSFAGTDLYYEGAVLDEPTAVAEYRADLATIAHDSTLRAFDEASGKARAAMLQRFWRTRDLVGLRREGERLREHYRRIYYARRHFALVSTNRHYGIEEVYRSGSKDFDDRGVIYIRHGEPTDRASYAAPGVEPNESWRYARADGDLVFHFIAREDVQDYKLVESLFDVLGFSAAVTLQSQGGAGSSNQLAFDLLNSRERISPVYLRLQSAGRISGGRYHAEERSLGRASIDRGIKTDSYELVFPRPLKAKTQVLAVGAEGDLGLVQVTFAIPGSAMDPVPTSRGSLYPVRLRFSLMDAAGTVVGALDTTRLFVSRSPVPAHEHLVGRAELPVPPGAHRVRVALQQGEDAGIVLPTEPIAVGNVKGTTFAMSDLVLGLRASNVLWHPTPTDTVFFNPLRTFSPRDELELYYEVYGLAAGLAYTTEIEVKRKGGGGGILGPFRRLFGGGGAALRIEFEGQSTGRALPTQRTFDLQKLKPGSYELSVTVEAADGRKARRTQEFQVVQ